MSRITELREIVAKYDLNKHPFYTDWRHGTLPIEKLDRYAEDYGHFVNLIAGGWDRLDRRALAHEEREHHGLWLDFAAAVRKSRNGDGTYEGHPALAETGALVDAVKTAFSAAASAVGALYAFEVQQPDTAQTKLDGLREHYKVDSKGEKYFEEHAGKWHEVEELDTLIGAMNDTEYERAKTACETVSQAMWGALDGIYGSKN
ncbi:MAG: iron-containing redox enzyme family protein [Armatimonadetes bacterium]|nr:iron-containing redox enzyme family protein [Armatimonadota bacterium]